MIGDFLDSLRAQVPAFVSEATVHLVAVDQVHDIRDELVNQVLSYFQQIPRETTVRDFISQVHRSYAKSYRIKTVKTKPQNQPPTKHGDPSGSSSAIDDQPAAAAAADDDDDDDSDSESDDDDEDLEEGVSREAFMHSVEKALFDNVLAIQIYIKAIVDVF